jgi:hypothetical protein
MALQTTITQFQAPGAPGLIANAETRNLISRSLAGDDVPFGAPVYRGASEDLCSGDAADGDLLGLARRMGTVNPMNGGDVYTEHDEVAIMTEGVMWEATADAVVAGTPARYNTATNLWTDAAVAGTVIAVPGAEFDSSTTAAGLAKVRYVRPIPA